MVLPKNKFDRLLLSTEIIAIKPNHSIILNMLREYENAKLNGEVTDEQIQSFYLNNMYKYYQLDGKSIILPEIYFNLKR